jgi:phosphoribosylformylglycinamidine cyclo-ligase
MVVDDLVVVGAEPLFLSDYIATGKVQPERIASIVGGIAEGCMQAGCALVGGETAEHPGLMGADEYDLSGTGVGVVNADAVLGAHRVRAGDTLIALGSSGLHANGFSLVRHVLLEQDGLPLTATPAQLGGRTLADELLTPTRIYARGCLDIARGAEVHAFAHVTGGGLAGNLARVLPAGLSATVDRSTWAPQPIFDLVATTGRISQAELERAFNLGVGMVVVVAPDQAAQVLETAAGRDLPAWPFGSIEPGEPGAPQVQLVGTYQGAAGAWC